MERAETEVRRETAETVHAVRPRDCEKTNSKGSSGKAVNTNGNECGRCGRAKHANDNECRAKKAKCRKCGIIGHYEKMCRTKDKVRGKLNQSK